MAYLKHHGIIGQKWGVRRFQNKDGSLTKAGEKRYSRKELLDIENERKEYENNVYNTDKQVMKKRNKAEELYKKAEKLDDRLLEYYSKNNRLGNGYVSGTDYMTIDSALKKSGKLEMKAEKAYDDASVLARKKAEAFIASKYGESVNDQIFKMKNSLSYKVFG